MDYFHVHRPLPGVFHLEDPRGVFLTLLAGKERALLIDTGMGIGNAARAVRELTDLPLTVCNTHGHVDHVGGNYQFDRVLVPPGDLKIIREHLTRHVRELLIDMSPIIPEDFQRDVYLDYAFDNVEPLALDAVMDLGGMTVRIVPLPTHSAGAVGYYVPELRLLLTGDSVAPMVYLVFEDSCSVEFHADFMEKLRDEIPARWLLSAHTDRLIPWEEIDTYIECARAADINQTVRGRGPLVFDYHGRMFFYESKKRPGETAILVFTRDKLGSAT